MLNEQTPDEVIENADLLDLSELTNALLEDPTIPINQNEVEDIMFEYRHFLAIKAVYNDTERPMTSSPSDIIHQVWRLHCQLSDNYVKCCRQLGVQMIKLDLSMCKDKLQEKQKKLEHDLSECEDTQDYMISDTLEEEKKRLEHDLSVCKNTLREKQKRLEMTKSRYRSLFPKMLMPPVFWEDFCTMPANEAMSGEGVHVKVEPTSPIKVEPTSHSKEETPVDLLRIKTEPGKAKGLITVRSDLEYDKGKSFPEHDKDKEKLAETEINSSAVTDEHSVEAMTNFASPDLNSVLQENLKKCGFIVPTPIQKSCLPAIMAGRDVMACSHTGSGKTATYLLPIIHKLMESGAVGREGAHTPDPKCLIFTATRELTLQIKEVVTKLSVGSSIKSCAIYDGRWPSEEIRSKQEANGFDILIATPKSARLLQFINKGWILVENLKFIVLDEADKLLSADFLPYIGGILKRASKDKRQTLMFSRTFPDETLRSGGELLNNYMFVASCETDHVCKNAPQAFYDIPRSTKRDKLKCILRKCNLNEKILIFVRTNVEADSLATDIFSLGFPMQYLQGDLPPKNAELALRDFHNRHARILVSTPMMIRGLDVNGVTLIINYDMPENVDDYIYRIGIAVHRRGWDNNRPNQNNPGRTINFIDRDKDSAVAPEIVKVLSDCGQAQLVPRWLSRAFGKTQAPARKESEAASAPKRKLTDKDENENICKKKSKVDAESTVKEISLPHTKVISLEEKLGKGEKETKRDSLESRRKDRKYEHNDQIEKDSIPRASDKEHKERRSSSELKRDRIYVENESGSHRDRKPPKNHFNLPPSKENDCFYYAYSSKCYMDANCPYRHEPLAQNSKTVCKYWKNGNCWKPRCPFRHFDKEKMNKCRFENYLGKCNNSRCKFRHVTRLDQ